MLQHDSTFLHRPKTPNIIIYLRCPFIFSTLTLLYFRHRLVYSFIIPMHNLLDKHFVLCVHIKLMITKTIDWNWGWRNNITTLVTIRCVERVKRFVCLDSDKMCFSLIYQAHIASCSIECQRLRRWSERAREYEIVKHLPKTVSRIIYSKRCCQSARSF